MIKEILLDLELSKPGDLTAAIHKPEICAGLGHRVLANKDYNVLFNKPSINGIELVGDLSIADLNLLTEATTEHWNTMIDFVPPRGAIIIYSDYATKEVDGETVNIPGIKIGDGMAYVVDLPFVGDDVRDSLIEHITNTIIHITQAERDAWNEKVRCYYDGETLVFTTEASE